MDRKLVSQWGDGTRAIYSHTNRHPSRRNDLPLLLNIALHGLEELLGVTYKKTGRIQTQSPLVVVSYADD